MIKIIDISLVLLDSLVDTVLIAHHNNFQHFLSTGELLSNEMTQCLNLFKIRFRVRGIVTDNHSANVSAFNIMLKDNPGDAKHYFINYNAKNKTYLFFDTVLLLKSVKNNLLNVQKFVFPAIKFMFVIRP